MSRVFGSPARAYRSCTTLEMHNRSHLEEGWRHPNWPCTEERRVAARSVNSGRRNPVNSGELPGLWFLPEKAAACNVVVCTRQCSYHNNWIHVVRLLDKILHPAHTHTVESRKGTTSISTLHLPCRMFSSHQFHLDPQDKDTWNRFLWKTPCFNKVEDVRNHVLGECKTR